MNEQMHDRDVASVVGAIELGGSHVSAAIVEPPSGRLATRIRRLRLDAQANRDVLLETIVAAAQSVHDPRARTWGVATPGPFDYAGGICLVRGVSKLDSLYGVDMRSVLAKALATAPSQVTFLNDADAFLLGEAAFGAAHGARRAMGITLGTGLGSAFLADGRPLDSGPGVPPEGRLDLLELEGRPVEDIISARGLRRAYAGALGVNDGRTSSMPDVAEIGRRARAGERVARETFQTFGGRLGSFLAPWLDAFAPDCLIVGGSIARAWDLFRDGLLGAAAGHPGVRITVAQRLGAAALLGAALQASRSA